MLKMKMTPFYALDGNNNPIKVDSVLEWGKFMEDDQRRMVARTYFPDHKAMVSTVFLGIDVTWGSAPVPAGLFETMAFQRGSSIGDRIRYATWKDAEAGHKEAVDLLRVRLPTKGIRVQLTEKEDAIS